jgi:hypothetical protein
VNTVSREAGPGATKYPRKGWRLPGVELGVRVGEQLQETRFWFSFTLPKAQCYGPALLLPGLRSPEVPPEMSIFLSRNLGLRTILFSSLPLLLPGYMSHSVSTGVSFGTCMLLTHPEAHGKVL